MQPSVKRIFLETDGYGKILNSWQPDHVLEEERLRLLAEIFHQGMTRLGYDRAEK
ncbi:MAG: hypothetical protein LBU77_05635 [Clostridiales bacterium]|nr:hypothetical protein [Clostridiales bacterium]